MASIRKFIRAESGALRLFGILGINPPIGGPNGTFDIELIDQCTDVVAPYGATFKVKNFSGFAYTDPAGTDNVYDISQHRIQTFWYFDDEEYEQVTTPNLPASHRNTNIATGSVASHVWTAHGPRIIYVYAFDDQGNWGSRTFTYGDDGDMPTIADPDVFFNGNKTICLSQAGDFTGAPAGSTNVTTVAAARSAMTALWQASTPVRSMRLLVRAGETFDNTGLVGDIAGGADQGNPRDNLKGLHVGMFGSGARPIFRKTVHNAPDFVSFPDRSDCRQFVVTNIDFRGPWDAATETGMDTGVGSMLFANGYIIFHRCRMDGFGSAPSDHDSPRMIVFSDTEITNWSNYGMYADAQAIAVLGCRIHQKDDALSGIGQETGGQQPTELGNRHGPHRSGSRGYINIFSASSFHSRNGWFPVSDGTSIQQSAEQACTRTFQHFSSTGQNLRRHFNVWDRCGFEGGDGVAALGPSIAPNNYMEINAKNFLIDSCIFTGTAATYGHLLGVSISGVTVRNCLFRRYAVAITYSNQISAELEFFYSSNNGGVGIGPVAAYNNTFLIETPDGELDANYAPIKVAAGHVNPVIENNVIRVVNRSAYQNNDVLPLGSTPLDTIAAIYRGARWNFRPIIISVGAARANETGTAAALAPGEWVSIPYPNQTGQCNGAGQQLTQALVTGNSTQKHQVSMTWRPGSPDGGNEQEFRRMTDTALFPGSKGGVTFDFTPTAIRMRNDTTRTWPIDRDIWLLLDQSDRLMTFLPGTAQNGNTYAALIPGPGSSAILPSKSGQFSRVDITGAVRRGELTLEGDVVNTGDYTQGCFTSQ